MSELEKLLAENDGQKLERVCKELIEALKFYATDKNYDDDCAPCVWENCPECVYDFRTADLGKIAKQALALAEEIAGEKNE